MFLYHKWLSLPLYVRADIAQKFGIAKVNPTHVADNKVINDGYLIKDVESALSVENIQKFLETKEDDMSVLFAMLITKIEGKEAPLSEDKPVVEKPVKKVVKKVTKTKKK